jgi:predicted RNase H-like nuclease (RuvC/YqgF family)
MNENKKWTFEEINELIRLRRDKTPFNKMAEKLGRTISACQTMIQNIQCGCIPEWKEGPAIMNLRKRVWKRQNKIRNINFEISEMKNEITDLNMILSKKDTEEIKYKVLLNEIREKKMIVEQVLKPWTKEIKKEIKGLLTEIEIAGGVI